MRRFVLLLLCFGGFYFLIFHMFRVLTDVGELRTSYPHVLYDAKEKKASIEIQKARPAGWVSLGAVSPLAVSAIVLSEDWAFYQHNGFDFDQIWDSFTTNMKQGKFARGGSTITQQMVKNVFLTGRKTIWRKIQEAVLAVRVERHLGKRRILEIYLNVVEFGPGLYGIGPASRFYFHKSPAELNAKEGAFLAMLLPSPKKYSVSFRKQMLTPYARSTVRNILGKLMATGRISEADYANLNATPLNFEAVAAEPVITAAPGADTNDETVEDSQSGEDDDSTQLQSDSDSDTAA
ncbi:MAG: transglycosylase domain-containing protein [Bdellovibrionota bacterium]